MGTVVVAAWNEIPAESTLRTLLTGTASLLTSQFRLTYSMILSLLRVSDLSVEDMIKRSFSEFHAQRALQQQNLAAQLSQLEARLETLSVDGVSTLTRNFFASYRRLRSAAAALFRTIVSKGWAHHLHTLYAKGRVLWLHTAHVSRPIPAIVLPVTVSETKTPTASVGSSELALANARLREEHMKASPGSSNPKPTVDTSLRVIFLLPDIDSSNLNGWTNNAIPAEDCAGLFDGSHFKIVRVPFSAVLCATELSVDVDGPLSSAIETLQEAAKLPPSVLDASKILHMSDFEVQNDSVVICAMGGSVLGPALDLIDSAEFSALWEEEDLKTKVPHRYEFTRIPSSNFCLDRFIAALHFQ